MLVSSVAAVKRDFSSPHPFLSYLPHPFFHCLYYCDGTLLLLLFMLLLLLFRNASSMDVVSAWFITRASEIEDLSGQV